MADFDDDLDDGIGSFGSTTAPTQPSNRDSDDEAWTPRKRSSKKAKKPKRKSKKKSNKGTVLKGVPPTRYPQVPKDHFFVLPPELRNRIYEYVLDERIPGCCSPTIKRYNGLVHKIELYTWAKRGSKPAQRITNANSQTPALLRSCPQIRDEASGLYYSMNHFQFVILPTQLESIRQWLATVTANYGCESNKFRPIGGFAVCFSDFSWTDIGRLLALSQIVRENSGSWVDGLQQFFGKQNAPRKFEDVVRDAIWLGQKAAAEGWSDEWLGVEFEEWLEEKDREKGIRPGLKRHARSRGLDEHAIKPLKKAMSGQFYATEELPDDEDDVDDFSRKKGRLPVSDRVTRSKKHAPAEKSYEKEDENEAEEDEGEVKEESDDDGLL